MQTIFANPFFIALCLFFSQLTFAQTLIPSFPQSNGAVFAAKIDGSTLYIGGNFTEVGGLTRNHAAAIDLQTFQVLPWNPDLDSTVVDVELYDDLVFLAGFFQQVGGQPRNNLAVVDDQSGNVDSWNPTVVFPSTPAGQNGSVSDIEISGDTVYLAGYFISVNGQSNSNIAALSAVDGSTINWSVSTSIPVDLVRVRGSKVFCAGPFFNINGSGGGGIALVDRFTGALESWYPSPDNPGNTWNDILLDGADVYLAGPFTNLGASPVNLCAKVDANANAYSGWNPGFGFNPANYKPIRSLAKFQGAVVVGGAFDNFQNGHQFLVSLDANNAQASNWYPQLNDGVRDLVVYGDTLIAMGDFTLENGNPRRGIAAYRFPAINLTKSFEGEVQVFPNPSSGVIRVKSISFPMNRIRLFDLSGRTVWEQAESHLQGDCQLIPVAELAPGAYMLEVSFENGSCRKKVAVY